MLSRRKKSEKITKIAKSVMTTTLSPFCLIVENLKNSPVEKAINARAISGRNSLPLTTSLGIRSRQKGPISIPVTIYAVTLGSLSFFVIRVIRNPRNSIIATEIMTTATEEYCSG